MQRHLNRTLSNKTSNLAPSIQFVVNFQLHVQGHIQERVCRTLIKKYFEKMLELQISVLTQYKKCFYEKMHLRFSSVVLQSLPEHKGANDDLVNMNIQWGRCRDVHIT